MCLVKTVNGYTFEWVGTISTWSGIEQLYRVSWKFQGIPDYSVIYPEHQIAEYI